MTTRSHAIAVYVDKVVDSRVEWDEIARKGCSGQLALEEDSSVWAQLFRDKALYPKLDCIFMSTCKTELAIAQKHNIRSVFLVDASQAIIDFTASPTGGLLILHIPPTRLDEIQVSHNVFWCLLTPGGERHDDVCLNLMAKPIQSYQVKDTKMIELPSPCRVLCFCVYGNHTTRQDRVERFNIDEMKAQGAYGCMLASCWLKEMAFRLGKAKKYGA